MQYGVRWRTVSRESAIPLFLGSPTLFVGIWMLWDGLPLFLVLYALFPLVILAY